ncbi:class I SAM-dependent methyltransferase [Roseomonas terrae]|uniref:S-adenosyl-L-methionine-dependent methyltransferase n=1 Tax=Neoroseomonas terrae TaxID=424799 RepID=A0ABS5ENB0_9PROT|nr:class I SAM-dependent methyltransferase [Neoroseomonas terrae]
MAHQLFDAPLVFRDPLAVPILGAADEAKLRAAEAGNRLPFALSFRAAAVARSRFCDDLIQAAVARGIRQVVVLGAGLDTLAYRGAVPAEVTVNEMDHPATQTWKRQALVAAGIPVPPAVRFLPIDLGQSTLEEGLRSGQFDFARPAFFSWLGVTYSCQPKPYATRFSSWDRWDAARGLRSTISCRPIATASRRCPDFRHCGPRWRPSGSPGRANSTRPTWLKN